MRAHICEAAPLLLSVSPQHQALPQQLHWCGRLLGLRAYQDCNGPRMHFNSACKASTGMRRGRQCLLYTPHLSNYELSTSVAAMRCVTSV